MYVLFPLYINSMGWPVNKDKIEIFLPVGSAIQD